MKEKQLLFSVTKKDLVRQTFSVGGHGGSGKDTSNSGVRFIHPPSGAVGEGREHRTNHRNEISAFEKLVASEKFKKWHKAETARRMGQVLQQSEADIKSKVDSDIARGIKDGTILIEYF